jgi:hypothetical protein
VEGVVVRVLDASIPRSGLRSVGFFSIFRVYGMRFPQLIAGLYDARVEGVSS